MFEDIERKWQERWANEKREYDTSKDLWIIDTPPPFTSGTLHMGHVLSYSYIDFVARYKMLKGYQVVYPQGWDAQGFPTEVKVEKKYGRLPREEFRKKCVEWSYEMIKRMREQMKRMGFYIDWNFQYITMEPEYHKKVQDSIIKMWEKGEIYREKHPVMWCPHCRSAIAKAELEDKEEDSQIMDLVFKADNKELLITTTRPELLHACVAVMVHPEDERYKDLVGKEAETPFGKKVPIIADKDVDKEFGTGVVMVCTYGDKQDVVWQKRYNLPIIESIDKAGRLVNAGEFSGLKVEEARKKIIEYLKQKGLLKNLKPHKKVVKVHDRCKHKVEFLLSMEWFASIKKHKEELKKVAQEIKWIPEFGIHHYYDWLDNLDWDWIISRDRIFGTPIPFYVCECGHIEPAKELPFYPEKAPPMKCPKCGRDMKPEEKVLDVWVDSSITPLVVSKYWDDPKFFEKGFPTWLRPQGVEIIRTWALYTIYRVWVLTGKKPWKEILLNGNVLAPDGKKMSKSLGNVISPEELLKQYPADALRQWAAMSGAMAKDRPFSYEDIKFAKSFLIKYWNASKFVLSKVKPIQGEPKLRTVDRWILAELSKLKKEVEEALENYDFRDAVTKMQDFYWHKFCDYYLEYVKWRFIKGKDEEGAIYALRKVQEVFAPMFSVFAPHLTNEVYEQLTGKPIKEWPEFEFEDNQALEIFERLNKETSKVRTHKIQNRMSMKTPLPSWKLEGDYPEDVKEDFKETLKIEKLEE
ncbi:MAG: valine--tRNA ligase [Candidatus Micrarchaeota archaeon]|nr:valine--tRNA ligase [Candidatus Micrarchaeota archaeon]